MDRTPIVERKNDSTRTSAGISRSLLTPCRRVGLTRSKKTNTPLTPKSPLTSNDDPTTTPKAKRAKLCKNINSQIVSTTKSADDDTCKNSQVAEIISTIDTNESINFSPLSINVSTQLSQKSDDDSDSDIPLKSLLEKDKETDNSNLNNTSAIVVNKEISNEEVSLPVVQKQNVNIVTLSKRCVSVIGKKMVKQPIVKLENITLENLDDDFSKKVTTRKANSSKKLEKTLKSTAKDKIKTTLNEKNGSWAIVKQNSIQSSPCTEDDDDFDTKKTILVRKSYNKEVSNNKVNLIKSKSTGTITVKDIEEINLRIRKKQQALGQKGTLQSNEELEKLIVKWRNGCQVALERLLTLMKEKVPEKSNMEMEELLKMLNIPVSLVKYNTDGICFD